jgi:hypothetical protein
VLEVSEVDRLVVRYISGQSSVKTSVPFRRNARRVRLTRLIRPAPCDLRPSILKRYCLYARRNRGPEREEDEADVERASIASCASHQARFDRASHEGK